jgi:hypothetical protein
MSMDPSATTDLGMNLPAPPGGFVNPSADGYIDQTGALRALRTPEQLAADRRDWINGFDQAAETARYAVNDDASKYTAEARAEHIAKFDAAARADGMNPVEPPSPELQHHADVHMIALAAKPTDYRPALGDHAAAAGEMTALAAELGLLPGIGNGFLERLVVVAEQKKGMTPEALANWKAQKRDELLRRVGSEQELAAQTARAKAELSRVSGVGKNLAKAIADDAVLGDWYLLSILATHSRGRESFEATRPDRRR